MIQYRLVPITETAEQAKETERQNGKIAAPFEGNVLKTGPFQCQVANCSGAQMQTALVWTMAAVWMQIVTSCAS